MSRPTLSQLYGDHIGKVSDKWSSYLSEYDRLFDRYRDKPIRLLEIGVQNGGSLEIWAKYFKNAVTLVGCDINPRCAELSFDDPRIAVVVGDANATETAQRVIEHSAQFDIVMDDGSHRASDIVKSFARYFPQLSNDGSFVVEDLHCSYWEEFEGGLFQPFSPMAFFKRLADVIDHEHWGIRKARVDLLDGFNGAFGTCFDEDSLARIHSIEFLNSMCVVRVREPEKNGLGLRVVCGHAAAVVGTLSASNGRANVPRDESSNPWATHALTPEEEVPLLRERLSERDEAISALERTLAEREGRIDALTRRVAEREGSIDALTRNVAERDTRIRELNGVVIEQGERNYELSQAVFRRDQIVAERGANIELLERRVADLLASTSWRLSAPVRFLGRQVLRARAMRGAMRYAKTNCDGYLGAVTQVWSDYRNSGLGGARQRIVLWALADAAPPQRPDETHDRNDYGEWVRRFDTLDDAGRNKIKARMRELARTPLISVIMPVYNPPAPLLEAAILSVQRQLYPNWELCIADDASTDESVGRLLRRYAEKDRRIKVTFRERNGHISAASNSAIELASGEYVAFLDHDDALTEHALFWVARTIADHPDAQLIYSDEDKIDEAGRRDAPYFKSNWNPDLFLSHNMICHLGVYRTELVRALGGLREGYEGAQDYDLALRCIERLTPQQICHIPRVLYHWRKHPGSTARGGSEKSYALPAGQRAINDHFARLGISASAELLPFDCYRTRYRIPEPAPMVSLIIPTRNGLHLLKQCVDSILEGTRYSNYEILIVDNGSDEPATLEYLARLRSNERIRVLRDDRPFNFSALNNAASLHARGELLGLVNNDVEVITPDWLGEMVSIAIQSGVGAVGARLWYPDYTLQHAGVVTGIGGCAGHAHRRVPKGNFGYATRAALIQSFSAVTAACLLIKKRIYEEVGGLDEVNLQVAFNDVDFCLRVRDAGYRNVWTPYAELFHHESASRGYEDTPERIARFEREKHYMQQRWGDTLTNDPAYNPNLTLEHEDFSFAWPPRVPSV